MHSFRIGKQIYPAPAGERCCCLHCAGDFHRPFRNYREEELEDFKDAIRRILDRFQVTDESQLYENL